MKRKLLSVNKNQMNQRSLKFKSKMSNLVNNLKKWLMINKGED